MQRWKKILRNTIFVAVVIILVGPFLVRVPPLTGTVSEAELADPDSKFIAVNDVSVHYKEHGTGAQTFILLHGFGASVFSWREVLDDFALRGRVIAYDRPAFGLTERPMPEDWSANPYGMDANIELLRGLMDSLKIQRTVLVGNSAGGALAVAFALRYPARVESLILIDPGLGGGRGPQFPAFALPLMRTPQMRHLGPLLVRDISETRDDDIRRAWSDPTKVTDEILAGYHKSLQVNNWDRALYELTFAPAYPEMRALVSQLTIPVFIIGGEDDGLIRPTYFESIARDIPGARLILLAGCGHVPHEECPLEFMSAVAKFLDAP